VSGIGFTSIFARQALDGAAMEAYGESGVTQAPLTLTLCVCYDAPMSIGRVLVIFGLVLVAVGLLWQLIGKIGLGRLPGDIAIERENFGVYIPLTTSLLISMVLSLLLWLLNR